MQIVRLNCAFSRNLGRGDDVDGLGAIMRGILNSAVGVLQTLVVALGAGLGIWGAINLLEGYGNDNRAMRS